MSAATLLGPNLVDLCAAAESATPCVLFSIAAASETKALRSPISRDLREDCKKVPKEDGNLSRHSTLWWFSCTRADCPSTSRGPSLCTWRPLWRPPAPRRRRPLPRSAGTLPTRGGGGGGTSRKTSAAASKWVGNRQVQE